MGEAVAIGVRRVAWILLLGAAAGLSACQNGPSHSMPCPEVRITQGTAYLTRFAGNSEDLTDTDFEAKLSIEDQVCYYVTDSKTNKTTIRTDLTVGILASRGPKNTTDNAVIKYNVAVTGPNASHLGDQNWRNSFEVTIPLPKNSPTAAVTDNPSITIPLRKSESGDFYQIHLSLDVTPKELAYNRRNPQQ
jgi:hypothetical protein